MKGTKNPAKYFTIEGRTIGEGHCCFVIAEAGVNHNGELKLGRKLIDAAHQAGADAIKFQTFKAERLVAPQAKKASYQANATGKSESQLEMLRKLELSSESFRELKAHAEKVGIIFLSTPFDVASADFLEMLGVAAFKIPSGEITNIELVGHIARKGKPLIVSTGMSTLEEVRRTVRTITDAGNRQFALLHCVSSYPAPAGSANLRAMEALRREFGCLVGFSDHTLGREVALAAAALGANILEKHITLDRTLPGPDHGASMEPEEFAQMIAGIRAVESALGDGVKRPAACEEELAEAARRSLVAAQRIPRGAVLIEKHVVVLRPGTGLAPAMRSQIIGRRAKRDIAAGELFALEMLE